MVRSLSARAGQKKNMYDTFMRRRAGYMLELPMATPTRPTRSPVRVWPRWTCCEENVVDQVKPWHPILRAVHNLKGTKHITDIRNFGLAAASHRRGTG